MSAQWRFDVAIVGAGPAGLAAALNLVRQRVRVLLLDANRPRHAATLQSHGFVTRDGVSPSELRRLGREEFLSYPDATFLQARLATVQRSDAGFVLSVDAVRGQLPVAQVFARVLVVATGLREELPNIVNLRAFYGTALHSCIVCDGYEKSGEALVLLPHPSAPASEIALAQRLLARFSDTVTVIADAVEVVADAATMVGVRRATGELVAATGGFVIPRYSRQLDFLQGFPLDFAASATGDSNCGVPGVFLAGEAASGKPAQLLVAAGSGAALVPDLLAQLP